MMNGIIIKGVGSYYYVMTPGGEVHECRLRGIFRKQKITPTVGDNVVFELNDAEENIINEILPRQSYLLRPMIANATLGVIVAAIKSPDLSTLLLDKMLVNQQLAGLPSIIVFNKIDLDDDNLISELTQIYQMSQAKLIFTDAKHQIGLDELMESITGHISVFYGVSAAGKSTIISALSGKTLETGGLSKFKRGKHTTRHSELIVIDPETFLMDTPGFSDLELQIPPEELWKYYPDFYEFSDCKFSSCIHVNEPGCNVKKAVEDGKISQVRYDNYLTIYLNLKENYKNY